MKWAKRVATHRRGFGAASLFASSVSVKVHERIELGRAVPGAFQNGVHNFDGRDLLRSNAGDKPGDAGMKQRVHDLSQIRRSPRAGQCRCARNAA